MTLQRVRYNGRVGDPAKNDYGPKSWSTGDEADLPVAIARALAKTKCFDLIGEPFDQAEEPHVEPPIIGLDNDVEP